MTPMRIVGIVLLVVGVVLLMMGMNASNSMADQFHHTFTGRYTDQTTWYIVSGIAVGVLGLVLVLVGGGKKGGGD